jgi:hypothetical protein
MMGTPWYTILSNDEYKDAFSYIGSYTDEREKLIEDDNNLEYIDLKPDEQKALSPD